MPITTDINISTKDRIWACLVTMGLLLVISWGVILSGNFSGRGAWDDLMYHWPAIERFADELPSPDLSDYSSATTPGYHLILSPMVSMGIGHTWIQLIASAWSIGLMGLLAWVVAGRFGRSAWVLMLPMISSIYVLFPGIWLLPDNAGWLGVLGIVLLALRPDQSWKTWMLSGLILVGLISMRQIHIWVAGVIWVSAWIGSSEQTPSVQNIFSSIFDRSGRTIIALACTIPAIAVLAWFVLLWGGLVPPTFQDQHQGPNPVTPAFILTQLAILSVFFTPMLWAMLKEIWKHQWAWVILAVFIGLLLGVVPESSYSIEGGRYSGWWNLIGKIPAIADRSPVIVLGAIGGAISLVVWINLVSRRDGWIWMGLVVGFTLAQSANHASWQRYHEPMLLMMILLILSRSSMIAQYTKRIIIGSLALGLMLSLVTAGTILNADPVVDPAVETQIQQPSAP